MRLPADAARLLAAFLAAALTACGGANGVALPPIPANGPQADYPVVLGEPYVVGGTTYTPADVLNYDEVVYLAADFGSGVTASHRTLPLPSYVEVTSLETGRTILVRVERRGPLSGTEPMALSSAALEQLGADAGTAVRIRRVNPLEEHRALLRAGDPAPPRMDTPMPLVEVLRRKLIEPSALPPEPGAAPPEPALTSPARGGLEARAPEQTPDGSFMVQAASFSTAERADNAARALGGTVTPSGSYFRVRTGPFVTRAQAEASLAKVRDAGYTDARILTSD